MNQINDGPTSINEKLKTVELPALQKMLLANEGPVQSLLGILFNIDVEVEVLEQIEYYGQICRWVRLHGMFGDQNITLCTANSIIPVRSNTPGIIVGIREKQWGIGKLVECTGIHTKRQIIHVYVDENIFARSYVIESIGDKPRGIEPDPRINIMITETFPRSLYNRLIKTTMVE